MPDNDVDGIVTVGQGCGEIGTDSKPTAPDGDGNAANGGGGGGDGEGKGARDATGNVGSDGEREAGSGVGVGVEGPEILLRPPTYGFNDKVR